MTNLPRLSGKRFTPAAYCQARQRRPLAALRRLLAETGMSLKTRAPGEAGCHGHRTWLIDGSSCSMPDTPALQKCFGQPTGQKKGCGFPVAHLLVLFEFDSGRRLDVLVSAWRINDLTRVRELHPHLQRGDILVADRGFCSYAHLAMLASQGVHVVLRMRRSQLVDFRPHRPAARNARDTGRPRSTWLQRCG